MAHELRTRIRLTKHIPVLGLATMAKTEGDFQQVKDEIRKSAQTCGFEVEFEEPKIVGVRERPSTLDVPKGK